MLYFLVLQEANALKADLDILDCQVPPLHVMLLCLWECVSYDLHDLLAGQSKEPPSGADRIAGRRRQEDPGLKGVGMVGMVGSFLPVASVAISFRQAEVDRLFRSLVQRALHSIPKYAGKA